MIDSLWILVCSSLVFFMQAGFTCLEAGITRSKNSINVAIKNLADFSFSFVVFLIFGFALMFGESFNGIIGTTKFFLGDDGTATSKDIVFFIFQSMFCATAITIVSGAVAERMRFSSYLFITVLVAGVIYPISGHWGWNSNGFLAQQGFVDFAGSLVVHGSGGLVALAAIIVVGSRYGRFPPNSPPQTMQASNLSLSVLGVIILWFGWLGFNGGSTLAFNDSVPLIILNTYVASSMSAVVTLFVGWVIFKKANVYHLMNGALIGLVAITANCHAVTIIEAAVIGIIAAPLLLISDYILIKLKLDDAVSAVPVHLIGGIWGTIAVALFGDPQILGTGLSTLEQLKIQLLGIASFILWDFSIALVILYLINKIYPLRVSKEAEQKGLNVAEHGEKSLLYDLLTTMDRQAQTSDFSIRATEEPYTTEGEIAKYYNKVLTSLDKIHLDLENKVNERTLELEEANKKFFKEKKKAESADKLKSEFLSNIGYEIKAPISSIINLTGETIASNKYSSNTIEATNLEQIKQSGEKLLLFIKNLLVMSELESKSLKYNMSEFDLLSLTKKVISQMSFIINEHKISFKIVSPSFEPKIMGDQEKVEQVIYNLISNSIKFSAEGKKITIKYKIVDEEIEKIECHIIDEGETIPKSELETIFDKFIKGSITNDNLGGAGIGLTICKEIIEHHNGKIWAENNDLGGTTVIFTLPTPKKRD